MPHTGIEQNLDYVEKLDKRLAAIPEVETSEVGVSVTIDNTKHLNEILDDLKKYGTVTVDKDMCIICVVGDLEWENVGFEAKALDAMRDIPVRMISFGLCHNGITGAEQG